jgi:hypothetical protein
LADFGYYQTAIDLFSIGDRVWIDANGDGILQEGLGQPDGPSPGIGGVTIALYEDLNGNGVVDAGEPLWGVAVTESDGTYSFDNVPPGNYIVDVTDESGVLTGYQTTSDAPTATDSKPDPYAVEIVDADVLNADFGFVRVEGGVITTTPVSLSYFLATGEGGNVHFEWSTATEVGNVGFFLYVEVDDTRQLVNADLIPSHVIDSIERQDYAYDATGIDGDTFFIEEVDYQDTRRSYGPFSLGVAYGAPVDPEPIDWGAIHQENSAKENERRGGWQHRTYPPIRILVDTDGLYRVTYEALRDAGLDLAGVQANQIALTNRGQPLAIEIDGKGTLGEGDAILFYGQALDTLYTDTNVYMLVVDKSLARRVTVDKSKLNGKAQPPAFYMETVTVDNNREYSFLSPSGDPWFDTSMFVRGTEWTWPFDLEADGFAGDVAASKLTVGMWGLTEMPQNPDHHVTVQLNGQSLAEEWFDGLVDHPVSVQLEPGVLQAGANTLELTMRADTGAPWDIVRLNQYSLTYPRAFIARDGRLTFEAEGELFRVEGLPSADVRVYRLDAGSPVRLERVEVEGAEGAFSATFAGVAELATYVVSAVDAELAPGLEMAPPEEDITSWPAQYLIISHPHFIEELQPLVAAKEAQGLTVRVVDVVAIYAQFGHGIFGAEAIRDYIAYAAANLGTEYVLLVGGDTYDYKDYQGTGGFSFIPSLYMATGAEATFAPVDPLYADLDGDNVPDLALGRFPVRTSEELAHMLAKTQAYENKDYGRTAVFSADRYFTGDSETFTAQLPAGWDIQRIYLDQIPDVSAANGMLVDALNDAANPVALTSFVGHSGPSVWTYRGLFSADDAASLTNAGQPTVVTQWGCWNTYYVAPAYDTLAHKFLVSGDNGAAAVLGATTVSYDRSEWMLGRFMTPRLVEPGMTIGQAMQAAKAELAIYQPNLLDVLLGWTVLGDPALVIEP